MKKILKILIVSFILGTVVLFGFSVWDSIQGINVGGSLGCPAESGNPNGLVFEKPYYPVKTIFFQRIGGQCKDGESYYRADVKRATQRIIFSFTGSLVVVSLFSWFLPSSKNRKKDLS